MGSLCLELELYGVKDAPSVGIDILDTGAPWEALAGRAHQDANEHAKRTCNYTAYKTSCKRYKSYTMKPTVASIPYQATKPGK